MNYLFSKIAEDNVLKTDPIIKVLVARDEKDEYVLVFDQDEDRDRNKSRTMSSVLIFKRNSFISLQVVKGELIGYKVNLMFTTKEDNSKLVSTVFTTRDLKQAELYASIFLSVMFTGGVLFASTKTNKLHSDTENGFINRERSYENY